MKRLKTNISVFILLFVNFIFIYKYAARVTGYAFFISLIIILIQYLVFRYHGKIHVSLKLIRIGVVLIFVLILGWAIFSHFEVPLSRLNVDRWSIISSFIQAAVHGQYPYAVQSQMGNYPGPMPVYFLIAFPFYRMGGLDLLGSLGYCIMVFLILMKLDSNRNRATFLLFFLVTSAFMFWEITTRSNIFTFTILPLIALDASTGLEKYGKGLRYFILAILTGLLLSTRGIIVLAYIVFFLSALVNKEIRFKRLFIFLLVAALAFLATFLPLLIAFKEEFFKINPFIVQSTFLVPGIYTLSFILFSMLFSFFVKNKSDKYFFSGLSLFISVLIYGIYNIVRFGYHESFIGSGIDISYFVFCVPFFMVFLLESNREEIAISINFKSD